MAAPVKFKSNDAGAPVLSGTVGALLGVLDYCLVAGLGWTKPFTATNKAVYRAPAGVRHYLDVDDTATSLLNAIRGYETMSAVGTGTGPFPTVAQQTTPNFSKSATADSVARPWLLFGDDRTFYLFIGANSTAFPPANPWSMVTFGEFVSVLAGDNYRTLLNRANENCAITDFRTSTSVAGHGHCPRTYTGLTAQAIWIMNAQNATLISASSGAAPPQGQVPFPNPADGGLYLSKILLGEKGTAASPSVQMLIRGRHRGFYALCHPPASFAEGDTFDGQGEYAGRSFYIAKAGSGGVCAIETTAWDVSV